MRKALIVPVLEPYHLGSLAAARDGVDRLANALRDGPGRFGAACVEEVAQDPIMQGASALSATIRAWLRSLRADDFGLLYFAGHGRADDGGALLAAWDAEAHSGSGWIDLTAQLHTWFKAGRLLVVLDCCHAGAAKAALTKAAMPTRDTAASLYFLGACPADGTTPVLSPLTTELIAALFRAPLSPELLVGEVRPEVAGAWVAGSWEGPKDEHLNPGGGVDALAAYRRSVLDTVLVPDAPWKQPDSVLATGDIERLIVPLALRARPQDDERQEHARVDGTWLLEDLVDLDVEANDWATGRWLVQGGPGAGKSTMLRRLARDLAAPDSRWLPVWAPLPWAAAGEGENLPKRVAAPCSEVAPGLAELLDAEARAGKVVLLCDGLDELPVGRSRQLALGRLKTWAAEWPGPIIVAGRHHGVSLDGPFLPVEVQPLGPEQQLELVRERLGGGTAPPGYTDARAFLEAHRERLGELAGNPFYLTLLALVFASGEKPGATPARMYLKVIDILLRGKHRRESDGRPAPGVRDPKRTFKALTRLAFRMTEGAPDEGSADEADEDDLVEWLDGASACQSQTPLELLNDVASKAGFLVREPDDDGRWRFLHRAFREVLCAQALVDRLDGDAGALAAHAAALTKDEQLALWANPWALAAGLLDDPDPLLRTLLDANEALAVDALLNAYTVSRETFAAFLSRPLPRDQEEVENRRRVYLAGADKLPNGAAALALVGDLVGRRLTPDERWFLDELCDAVKARWPAAEVESVRRSIYADLPAAPDGLVRWSEVIPAGRFWMGSPEGVGHGDEHPRHLVTLTRSYQLGTTPVTNRQWQAFDPEHEPYAWAGVPEAELADHPVVKVSWYAAQAYCRWLSHSWGVEVRVPTEAEWERACRGPNGEDEANHDRWSFGDSEAQLKEHAWYSANSDRRTHAVGTTPAGPGPWGLHDMHGNVWEWCSDWFSEDYYARAEANGDNPKGPSGGGGRVVRGGSFWSGASGCRSAYRDRWLPAGRGQSRGFRVLLPAAPGT